MLLLFGCDESPPSTGLDGAVPDGGAPAACSPPEEIACAKRLGVELPVERMASTAGGADSHGAASCWSGGGVGVPDVAFQWTAPRAGRYDISTEGSGFDTLLSVHRGGCDGEEIACNDDVNGSREARLTIELDACETIVIVVDGWQRSDVGDVRLTVKGREEVCDDGLDDDGDGLVDCDDPDCRTRECVEDGAWPEAWADFEWRVLELTNERRAAPADCGGEAFAATGPLEMNETIRVAARLHSQDMGEQDYFEHDSLDGRSFDQRMREAGFAGPSPWGENIAAGQRSPEDVVAGWMASPGHCKNIMNPRFNVIGIGYAEDASSTFRTYWTQDFANGH